jgi:flagellar basal-body rod protein FlgB
MDDFSYNKPINPTDSLGVALQGLSMRSKAIAGNLANINVPDYKRQTVNFEEQLQQAQGKQRLSDIPLTTTNAKHFSNTVNNIREINLQIETDPSSIFVDKNNVDIDREMLDLTKTGLSYKAVTGLTKRYFDQMKGIVRG